MTHVTSFHEDYIAFKHTMLRAATYTEDQLIALFGIYRAETTLPIEAAAPEPKTVRPWIQFTTAEPMEKKFSIPGAGVI